MISYELNNAIYEYNEKLRKGTLVKDLIKGGPGSGFYEHAGRKGEVGGSGKGTGGKERSSSSSSSGTALYHGTTDKQIYNILNNGLIPGKFRNFDKDIYSGDRKKGVFMTSSLSTALFYAESASETNPSGRSNKPIEKIGSPVILKIVVPKGETLKQDKESHRSYYRIGKIPKEWISSYKLPNSPNTKWRDPEEARAFSKSDTEEEIHYLVLFLKDSEEKDEKDEEEQ